MSLRFSYYRACGRKDVLSPDWSTCGVCKRTDRLFATARKNSVPVPLPSSGMNNTPWVGYKPEVDSKLLHQPGTWDQLYPNVAFKRDAPLDVKAVIDLYRDSGLIRPLDDEARIKAMYDNSNLTVSAWDGDLLVGVARSVTDFVYCCYLSDLAVRKDYQKGGVGKELLRRTKEIVGPQSMMLLLAAETTMEYYPKVGMTHVENGFIVKRET